MARNYSHRGRGRLVRSVRMAAATHSTARNAAQKLQDARDDYKTKLPPNYQPKFRFNLNSQVWFGKYKGHTVAELPTGYVLWLLKEHKPGYQKINDLCFFLAKQRTSAWRNKAPKATKSNR